MYERCQASAIKQKKERTQCATLRGVQKAWLPWAATRDDFGVAKR